MENKYGVDLSFTLIDNIYNIYLRNFDEILSQSNLTDEEVIEELCCLLEDIEGDGYLENTPHIKSWVVKYIQSWIDDLN